MGWFPTAQIENKHGNKTIMKKMLFLAPLAGAAAALLSQPSAAQNASRRGLPVAGYARPAIHFRQRASARGASLTPTGLTPAQIRQAYGFDQLPRSIDGTGQTIAMIDADGNQYVTGTTSSDGTITFQSSRALLGTYTTQVASVTASDLTSDGITSDNSYPKTQ